LAEKRPYEFGLAPLDFFLGSRRLSHSIQFVENLSNRFPAYITPNIGRKQQDTVLFVLFEKTIGPVGVPLILSEVQEEASTGTTTQDLIGELQFNEVRI
jgi:hypothetical protein